MYQVWATYMSRYKNKMDGPTAIQMMKFDPITFSPKAIDCFAAIGLVMFAEEYLNTLQEAFNG